MSNYLLSIVIPTRNRQLYCMRAVRQILSHGWEQVEICIQDNSDNNELEREMDSLGTAGIVYNHHPGVLSFVDNFSEAVSLAHGKYVCMIGDDDSVLPDLLPLLADMEAQQADAAIPALNFIYFWPSANPILEGGEEGVLIAHLHDEKPVAPGRCVNSREAVKRLLRRGVQDYTSLDMPRLYHGVVKRSMLEKIKEVAGNYFGGLTPDMYMATALSLVCNKVLRVQYSVTLSGICPTSGSSDSATGKHTGQLGDAPHFRGHAHYQWEEQIPAFYSVDTIWADTLFHALRDFGQDAQLRWFNRPLFTAVCVHRYPEFANLVLTHARSHGCHPFAVRRAWLSYRLAGWVAKGEGRFKAFLSGKGTRRTNSVPDLMKAEQRVQAYKGGTV